MSLHARNRSLIRFLSASICALCIGFAHAQTPSRDAPPTEAQQNSEPPASQPVTDAAREEQYNRLRKLAEDQERLARERDERRQAKAARHAVEQGTPPTGAAAADGSPPTDGGQPKPDNHDSPIAPQPNGNAQSDPARRPLDETLRTQWFNYQSTPWPDVLQQFAAKAGKPVNIPADVDFGDPLTLVSARRHTVSEARDEVNRLLLPRGYQLVDTGTEFRVAKLAEMAQYVAPERTYDSAAAFQTAGTMDGGFAVVFLEPGDTSASEAMAQAHKSLTQNIQMTTDADTGRTKLLGPARDLRRFIMYKDNIVRQKNAGRATPAERQVVSPPALPIPDTQATATPAPDSPRGAPPALAHHGESGPADAVVPAATKPDTSEPSVAAGEGEPPAQIPHGADSEGGTPPTLEQLEERARLSTQTAEDQSQATSREGRRGRANRNRMKVEKPAEQGPVAARPPADANQPRPTSGDAGKNEWFAFDGMPWEDVIDHFARRLKKPLMDKEAITVGGTLTYTNPRIMTKEDAIDELNLLLHEKGWRFVETEHHIFAVPLSEMPARVPLDRTFESVEKFRAANLRDMEYCTVYMRVENRPAEDLVTAFADAFPDYTRMHVVAKTNQIKMVMLARDIRKFLNLMDRIGIEQLDPRQIKVFNIKTNPREMESLVREMVGAPAPGRATFNRQTGRVEQPQQTPESDIRIIADDRTNSLIVRATQEKLDEIDRLLDQLDIRQDVAKFDTTVIPILHGNAVDIANSLNQIFQVEQAQTPTWQRTRTTSTSGRTTGAPPAQPQPGQPPQTDWLGYSEDLQERARKMIRIAAEDRTNSIIVYANKDGLDRVRKMLETIDVALPSNFRSFKLTNAKAEHIYDTVNALAQGMRGSTRGASSRGTTITLDAAKNTLHVVAEREAMQNIEKVIAQLDVETPEGVRHVLELKNLTPSRAAQIAQSIVDGGAGAAPRTRPGRGGAASFAPTSQIIPLDEAGILIVVLDDDEVWQKVEDSIRLLDDKAVSNTPTLRIFPVAKGDPRQIADTLAMFYRNYRHPTLGNSPVAIAADGDKIYVQAIKPAQEEIASLLATLDVDASEFVILPLAHADASQVAAQASQMFAGPGAGRRGGGQGGMAVVIQADQGTNSLIVQADKTTLEKIKDFAQQRDNMAAEQAPQQKLYTLKNAPAQDVANAITQLFSGGGGRRAQAGAVVRAIASGSQVIVDAPAEKQSEIAAFIAQMDDPAREVVELVQTETRQLAGQNVANLAAELNRQWATRPPRPDRMRVTFSAEPLTETLIFSAPKDAVKEIDELIAKLSESAEAIATVQQFIPVVNADANYVAGLVTPLLQGKVRGLRGQEAANRISVTVDIRLNRLVVNAPRFAMEWADTLVKELDVVQTREAPFHTIQLEKLDANALVGILNQVMAEKLRTNKNLRISAEPLTNSLIVAANNEDFAEIEKWSRELESKAASIASQPQVFELLNANPWEVLNVLNTTFMPRGGQRFQPGKEIVFNVIGGQSIIVQAPQEKMESIASMVKKLDEVGVKKVEIRTYELPGIGDQIDTMARQVQEAVNAGKQAREQRVSISTYPQADTWIVAALPNQFAEVESMMEKFRVLVGRDTVKTHFVDMQFADAAQLAPQLTDLVTKQAATGGKKLLQNLSIMADGRTNRLIVRGTDKAFDDVKAMIDQLDVEAPADNVVTLPLKFADPNETANTVNAVFGWGRRTGAQRSFTQDVSVTVSNNMLVVKAPPKDLERIKSLVNVLDAKGANELVTKTYDLKVLNATAVATQVQMYLMGLGTNTKRGQMKPAAFGEPTTNTLVVIAPQDAIEFIDMLVASLESKEPPRADAKPYALRNAQAGQVAQNVQNMLRSKVTERYGKGREQMVQTAVFADPASNRLFVFAPPEFQELAAELVSMIDTEVDTGQVVRIVSLQNADATTLAQSMTSVIQGFGQNAQVKLVPDAGSNSIILNGLPKDVAKAEKLIADLEGTSEQSPDLQIFPLQYANTLDVVDTLKAMFTGGRTPLDTVVVTEDEWNDRVIVSTGRRKMRQVEAVIAQLDADPIELGGPTKSTYFVDVFRGDAYDIARSVRDHFPDEKDGGPSIEDDWDGEYIIVRCKEHDYPEIERLIREYDKRSKLETKFVTLRPKGDISKIMPLLIQKYGSDAIINMPDVAQIGAESLIEELWKEGETPRKAAQPRIERGGMRPINNDIQPCVLSPFGFHDDDEIDRAIRGMMLRGTRRPPAPPDVDDAALHQESGSPPASSPAENSDSAKSAVPAAQNGRKDADSNQKKSKSSEAQADTLGGILEKLKAEVTITKDGRIFISGPKKAVEDLQDAIDLITEDIGVGEVIRIFHFKYGDVNAAAQILDRMFNDRTSMAQAQARQMQQLMMNRQGGRGGMMFPGMEMMGGGDEGQQGGRAGRGGQGGGGLMDTLRGLTGRGGDEDSKSKTVGSGQIRIATDPGHSYLIVKCDEAALPEIRQMLKELDIPPGQVDVKVFQLKSLVADEVARNIKEVLGIVKAEQRRTSGTRQQGGAGMNDPFFQMFQQQLVAMSSPTPGGESGGAAKIESVEIVPNVTANSLMVSAPPDVMRIIEDVITKLEGLEGRSIVGIHRYELKKARVDDVVPLLDEVFSAVGGGGFAALTRGGAGGGRSSSPAAMGQVNISADPRTNTIIYTCESKDVETVEAQIAMLDIEGPMSEAEIYVCQYGDAVAIADVVDAIYGSGATGARGGGAPGRRASALPETSGTSVRITSEPTTNTIVVWGPREKRDLVFNKIEELDKLNERSFREIPLANADPEQLAAKLSEMFSGRAALTGMGASATRRAGAGAAGTRTSSVSGDGRIVIMGDSNARKLLVKAPEQVFKQILNVVQLLDVANKGLQVERFALHHAKAENVVADLKQAMTEYVQINSLRGGGGALPFDAFTVLPDTRTNSLLVVGSEQTFAFVKTVLSTYDVETPDGEKRQFRIFALSAADATTVADAINTMAASSGGAARGASQGMAQTAGRRAALPSMPGGGGTRAGDIDVFASADLNTNSVLVSGRPDDIALVEKTVIDEFERMATELGQPVTIPVTKAQPSQLATFISRFFSAGDAAAGRGRGGTSGRANPPTIIPNDNTRMLIVRGTKNQIEHVRDLVAQFDDPAMLAGSSVKVIPIPLGQDAVTLAREVERVVNDSQRNISQQTGATPQLVTIGANAFTNSLMVAGDPSTFGIVDAVVDQLGAVRSPNFVTRIVQLKNVSADDAQTMIDRLNNRNTGSSSGSRQPSGTRGGGSGFQPGGSFPQGGFNFPQRGGGQSGGAGGQGAPAGGANRPQGGGAQPVRPPGGGGGGGGAPWSNDILPCVLPIFIDNFDDELSDDELAWERPFLASRQLARNAANTFWNQFLQPVASHDAQPGAQDDSPADRRQRSGRDSSGRVADRARQALQEVITERGVASGTPDSQPSDESATSDRSGLSGSLRGEVFSTPLDSQRIIITGDESDIAFIEQILGLMEATGPAAKIEVIPLQHTKATTLGQAVRQIVEAWISQRTSRPGPSDRINVVAEAKSNSLVVSATENNLELIRDIIAKLDVESLTGATSALIALRNVPASEAVTILTPMLRRLGQLRDLPDAQQPNVQAVGRSNSLLVTGTPPDIDEIRKLVETLDVKIDDEEGPGEFTTGRMVIINLKNALAPDVASLLTDMIKAETDAAAAEGGEGARRGPVAVRKLKLRTADGKELPELNLEKPIRVIAEKGTNSLIIFSSEKNNTALTEIVGLFDTLPAASDVDVKSFAMQHADAVETAEALQKMFNDGKKALMRPADAGGTDFEKGVLPPLPSGAAAKGLPYDVVISADGRTNTVFVIGRKDAVTLAGALITQIDQPGTNPDSTPNVIVLKNMQASTAAEKLTQLMDKRTAALGKFQKNPEREGAIIIPEDRSNQLIVVASPDVFEMVRSLTSQLDNSAAYRIVDTEYRHLDFADSNKLQGILQELFDRKSEAVERTGKSETQDAIFIIADARSNSLMLTGTRDYLTEAGKLIDKLDRAFDPTVEFRIRPVLLNSAVNIAGLLQQLIEKTKQQTGGGEAARASTPIHIAADPTSNSLVLGASHEDMLMVEKWVEVLDRPLETGRMTVIVPMRRLNAEEVAQSVQELFTPKGGSTGGAAATDDTTVTFERTTNSVVAFGPPGKLREIEAMLRKMDDVDPKKAALLKIFKLQQADAEDAQRLLTSLLEGRGGTVGGIGGSTGSTTGGSANEKTRAVMLAFHASRPDVGIETLRAMRDEVSITADVRTNSLFVAASPDSMPLMESLVSAIDVPPDAAMIRTFPLRNASAEEMVRTLETLFQRQRQGASGAATGGATQGNQQRELVLDGGAAGGRQEVTFTTDVRTNSVIAAGTKGYLDRVEELIIQLDSQPIRDRKTLVYLPRNNEAASIAASIREFSDAEKQRFQDLGQDISTARKMEREIVAIANEDSNTILISFDQNFEDDVMRIVRDLDQPPPQVMIQVLIIEVTLDNSLELGVEFAFQDLQFAKAGPSDTTTYDYVGGTDLGAVGAGLGGFTFTVTGADFNFLIRTLQNEGNIKVLSRPMIMAMDNQEASFNVSNDVPYVSSTAVTTGGVVQTNVAREDVGIDLTVTPQINPDGYVRMQIRQEVSDFAGSTVDVGNGVTAPVFLNRVAETTVTVMDNETVVLGGLITTRSESRDQKVPILGDIPVLGLPFRNTVETTSRTELLIVLTPRVVRTIEDFRSLSVEERDRSARSGLLDEDVLTSPFMNKLRVKPEELFKHGFKSPAGANGSNGNGEITPLTPGDVGGDEPVQPDEYGPVRPSSKSDSDKPAAYDIPIVRRK